MGITAQSAENIVVGAGDVYIDGVLQGATEEDNVFRITREYFSWKPNGVRGPVKGADYVIEEIAEMEFTLPEISPYFMGLMVPGSEMVNTAAVTTGGGGSSTLNGAVAAGATSIVITSATNFATGDYIKIAGSGITEVRGPITVAGTTFSFDVPLSFDHPTLAVVTEVDATGIVDRITSGEDRRLPSTAYHTYEIRIPGLDGREVRFGITDAIASESPEFTGTDAENMKPRITVQGRYDGAAPQTAPWYIDKYSATA
jgi:hypothetical protein